MLPSLTVTLFVKAVTAWLVPASAALVLSRLELVTARSEITPLMLFCSSVFVEVIVSFRSSFACFKAARRFVSVSDILELRSL